MAQDVPPTVARRIKPKDLITTGIFTAIYFVIIMAVAMLGYIPIFIPLLAVICPLVGGIPYMLFASKVRCFGMVTIMGILMGIIMGMGGMGVFVFATGPIFGVLADLVLRAGGYTSVKHAILSHGVLCMWLIGNYIPIVLTRDAYYQNLVAGYGKEYADALMGFIPDWSLAVLLIALFVCGCIGAWIGHKVFKKHFERAGIA